MNNKAMTFAFFVALNGCDDPAMEHDEEALALEEKEAAAAGEEERPITNAPHPVAGVPCGIYVPPVAYSPGQTPTYYYTIKNCHNYTVYRYSVFSNGTYGSCRQYSAGEVYYGSNVGRYPVDLNGC